MSTSQYRQVLTDSFPPEITIDVGGTVLVYRKEIYTLRDGEGGERTDGLRYGENPGQEAALYRLVNGNLVLAGVEWVGPGLPLVSGLSEMDPKTSMMYGCRKHPSKTNLTDVDSALNALRYMEGAPAAVVVKHNNPSGAAMDRDLSEAFRKAYDGDAVAAFGGAAVVNRPLDKKTAEMMNSKYLEVVAAPDFEEGAVGILTAKPDLRIFRIKNIGRLNELAHKRFLDIKSLIDGGIVLQQSPDNRILTPDDFLPAECEYRGTVYRSERAPDRRELGDLCFGWAVEQAVVSNSVLFVKDGATVAIAGGQQDRVGVVEIAVFKARRNYAELLCWKKHGMLTGDLVKKAKESPALLKDLEAFRAEAAEARGGLPGSVLVSDAFFPFRDALDAAISEGITAVAHPGGAIRDYESLMAANEASPKVAMVFTGQRAFKH
ncbi:MAG: IMP cyclohydrolase [Deltaproteobacteria bacterium]|jgi:phosphoribosylaminoimidazolecarboxamide formyltransferase/IMP cyclohydrolase|nr:IMP cyclohydrolase [Deltaproteobacteria bacterium]